MARFVTWQKNSKNKIKNNEFILGRFLFMSDRVNLSLGWVVVTCVIVLFLIPNACCQWKTFTEYRNLYYSNIQNIKEMWNEKFYTFRSKCWYSIPYLFLRLIMYSVIVRSSRIYVRLKSDYRPLRMS